LPAEDHQAIYNHVQSRYFRASLRTPRCDHPHQPTTFIASSSVSPFQLLRGPVTTQSLNTMSPSQESQASQPLLSSQSRSSTSLLQRGVYAPPAPDSLRCACPIVNSLANHGYIPRDGRGIRFSELNTAVQELGISSTISLPLTAGIFAEHLPPNYVAPSTLGQKVWALVTDPKRAVLGKFGVREVGEVDGQGYQVLNLDQVSRHGAVEHDVSLTRRDFAQGDNHSPQPDLVAALLHSSSDGMVLTTESFAGHRMRRMEQQRRDNRQLSFGEGQHRIACGEVALIQRTFGHAERKWEVPVSYVKAIFEEERLPVKEGWQRRRWWLLGWVEFVMQIGVMQKAIGSYK
jgi:hypothetical protein